MEQPALYLSSEMDIFMAQTFNLFQHPRVLLSLCLLQNLEMRLPSTAWITQSIVFIDAPF
jgi:hypothetical protein